MNAPMKKRDPELEAAVLGRILVYRDGFARVADQIGEHLFTDPSYRQICRAVVALRREGISPDEINVADYLVKHEGRRRADLLPLLLDVTMAGDRLYDIERAVLLLREINIHNQLVGMAHKIISADGDALELLDSAMQDIIMIQAAAAGDHLRHISDAAQEAVKEMEEAVAARKENKTPENAISTGYPELDRAFSGGWRAGELILLAGRPAMGKTAEALNIAANVAKTHPVLFFSLEMRDTELANRVICSTVGLNGMNVRRGELDSSEIFQYAEGASKAGALNLMLDQRSNRLTQLSGVVQRWRLNNPKGVGLIVVDYLQLIDSEVKGKSTNDQVGAISRTLKLMALQHGCVVLALSQLNRAVETTSDRRPALQHLRDSGNLEQDADAVIFTYRPEYYGFETDEEGNSTAGLCQNIVAKNRHGITGVVYLQFIAKYGRFADWGHGVFLSEKAPF